MFNIGFPELIVIFGVALLAFGPEKLPELARKLGKWSAELRRHSDGIRREFYNEIYKPADDARRHMRNLESETKSALLNLVQDEDKNCEEKAKTLQTPASPDIKNDTNI